MAIYMHYTARDSGDIKGDVTAAEYTDWIEVDSFDWGVHNGMGSTVGSSFNMNARTVVFSEVKLTKMQDQASGTLLNVILSNQNAPSVKLSFLRPGTPAVEYLSFELTNACMSHYSMSSTGDRPVETVKLVFQKITMNVTPQNPDGTPGSKLVTIYDLTRMSLQ